MKTAYMIALVRFRVGNELWHPLSRVLNVREMQRAYNLGIYKMRIDEKDAPYAGQGQRVLNRTNIIDINACYLRALRKYKLVDGQVFLELKTDWLNYAPWDSLEW